MTKARTMNITIAAEEVKERDSATNTEATTTENKEDDMNDYCPP